MSAPNTAKLEIKIRDTWSPWISLRLDPVTVKLWAAGEKPAFVVVIVAEGITE